MPEDRTIIHIDMDAFYAAIEQRDNPTLRGKPVVIGGRNPYSRGVVSTASYEARKYGIHSAMPLIKAYQQCPQAVFLPSDRAKYKGVSQRLHRIFRLYTPIIEPISLDEAFLDVTQNLLKTGSKAPQGAVSMAQKLKEEIKDKLELTASVGISHNKFLAKLASEMKKPDGLTVIPKDNVREFLSPLPVRRIWGVGPRSEDYLRNLGIFTIGDLQLLERDFLVKTFGKWGHDLYDLARGVDHRPVTSHRKPKSIGEETTFAKDRNDPSLLSRSLAKFSKTIWQRCDDQDLLGRTVTLKIRYSDFTTVTRSHTFPDPALEPRELYRRALYLLSKVELRRRRVRLIGLSVSNFIYPGEPYQLTLW